VRAGVALRGGSDEPGLGGGVGSVEVDVHPLSGRSHHPEDTFFRRLLDRLTDGHPLEGFEEQVRRVLSGEMTAIQGPESEWMLAALEQRDLALRIGDSDAGDAGRVVDGEVGGAVGVELTAFRLEGCDEGHCSEDGDGEQGQSGPVHAAR